MTTIDIISGFLGAGKTTLIKKLIQESFQGQKLVLIENEFGEIGIDGGFMKDAGIEVTEMNSGCICCSLVGDFGVALKQVLETYAPDRIIIEPSGVGKLSDVAKAVGRVAKESELQLGSAITVVNAKKAKMYMKNFGEFFDDQVQHAGTIILSRTADMAEDKLEEAVSLLRAQNADAVIITTDWAQITGDQILSAMERHSLADELLAQAKAEHHHHDHDEDAGTSITTITTTMRTDTSITITTTKTASAPAAITTMTMTTIITMPTMSSPPGAWSLPGSLRPRRSRQHWRDWIPALTVRSSGPRALSPMWTAAGSTSTMCRVRSTSAPALPM